MTDEELSQANLRRDRPKRGSLWVVAECLPYQMTVHPDVWGGASSFISGGDFFLVLDDRADHELFVKILTQNGKIGFVDAGWWIYSGTRRPVLIEVGE